MSFSLTPTPNPDTANVEVLFAVAGGDVPYWPRVTLTRAIDGEEPVMLRGADSVTTSGGLLYIIDSEAPFGVELTYTAISSLGGATTAVTTLDVASTWLKVPGHAELGTPVIVADHDRVDAYETPMGVFPIVGSRFPVTVAGTTSARTTSVKLLTTSRAEAAHVLRVLRSSPVVLIETPAGHALERGYFTLTGFSRSQVARANGDDGSIWELPLIEVDIPTGGSASGGVTWETIAGTYATWTALRAAVGTWLDLVSA